MTDNAAVNFTCNVFLLLFKSQLAIKIHVQVVSAFFSVMC